MTTTISFYVSEEQVSKLKEEYPKGKLEDNCFKLIKPVNQKISRLFSSDEDLLEVCWRILK
jgi:hypothetical protein